MHYESTTVTRRTRILFPIITMINVGLLAPSCASLVVFLMFGNLIRECGVLQSLAETARGPLTNLITLLLGITISFSMKAETLVRPDTLLVMGMTYLLRLIDGME